MELPLLGAGDIAGTTDAFVRAIKKAWAESQRYAAEAAELDGALVFTNSLRPLVHMANCALDVKTPEDQPAAEVFEHVHAAFAEAGTKCHYLVPSDPVFDAAWAALLSGAGYERRETLVMAMRRLVPVENPRSDFQVLPARAVIPQYHRFRRALAAAEGNVSYADQLAAAFTDMLDDPRLDMVVARLDQEIIAAAGVYSLGETGILWDLATHPDRRREGIMRGLLHRVFELCARSQFKRLILDTTPENVGAIALYRSMGMEVATSFESYRLAGA